MLLPGPLNSEMIILYGRTDEGHPNLDQPYLHEGETVILFSSLERYLSFDSAPIRDEVVPCQIADDEGFIILLANLCDFESCQGARHVIIDPHSGVVARWPIQDVMDYIETIIEGGLTIPELN